THEGEYIPIEVSYTLGVESGGTFTGSTYVDNYGNLPNQKLVGGSLEVSVNNGAYSAVPQSAYNENNDRLTINLEFMAEAGFAGTDSVAGQHFIFRYKTTVPDSDLGGSAVRTVTQVGTLTVNNGSVSD